MKIQFIDIHSHLNFPEYDQDREAVLARMKESGVATITVGVDYESSASAVALAEAHENIYACIGLHPHDNPNEKFDAEAYRKLAAHPKVAAIGECGLDYSRMKDLTGEALVQAKMSQRKQFISQIELANELGKPLMLHIRDAYDDAFEVLKGHAKVKGDVHFFAGDISIAKKFVEFGFTLSFTGVITFARSYDEVIRAIPLNMIMSETDSPFVSPVPYRGKRNEPAWVSEVVKKIAELRGESLEEVSAQLLENARRVFSLSIL